MILDKDVRKIKYQFGCLVTKTRDSVEERITVVKLSGSILSLMAYEPALKEPNWSLLDEHRKKIKAAESISVLQAMPLQREEESSHTATIKLSPQQKLAVPIKTGLFVDCCGIEITSQHVLAGIST